MVLGWFFCGWYVELVVGFFFCVVLFRWYVDCVGVVFVCVGEFFLGEGFVCYVVW